MYEDELRSRRYYEGRVRWYDWGNRLAALLRGTSGRRERLKAIARLRLKPDDNVLEVSCGTGTNLALMHEALAGAGALVGLDISRGMLLKCRRKIGLASPPVRLVEAEAAHLPFRDGVFDAVLHHGGLAEFGDTAGALSEMTRVARPGARIVMCDVGVPTDRPVPLMSRLLLRIEPVVYRKPPPLELLPASLQDLQLTWIGGGAWYMIDFSNNPEESRATESPEETGDRLDEARP